MKKYVHLDSDESIFFSRQLEYLKTKSYDIKYADLKARSLIPVTHEAGPGAKTITYEQYDQVGMAKIITHYGDEIPRADVRGKEFIGVVKSLASSYGYSVQEIREARFADKPLVQRKANSAKRAIMQLEDDIAATGDATHRLQGFVNGTNISTTTIAADGTGNSTNFSTKTPANVIRDLNKIANFITENTQNVEKPDTLLLPVEQYNYVASTPRSDTTDTTILNYFLSNNTYINEVISWTKLKGAGASNTDRMIAYCKSPEKLELEIPQDFEQFDPELRNLEYVVNCHSRCGGVSIYYPLSICYVDGI